MCYILSRISWIDDKELLAKENFNIQRWFVPWIYQNSFTLDQVRGWCNSEKRYSSRIEFIQVGWGTVRFSYRIRIKDCRQKSILFWSFSKLPTISKFNGFGHHKYFLNKKYKLNFNDWFIWGILFCNFV